MTLIDGFDPASPEALTNPLEYYRWLRDEHPMYYVEAYDMWFVSRFEDIWTTMGDSTLGLHGREVTHMNTSQLVVHNHGAVPPDRADQVAGFPSVDPPAQGTLRGLVNQPFRPGAVGRLEAWFRDMVRTELQDVLAQGTFNLTDALGQWAARTMARIAGIPPETAPRIRELINDASDQTGDPGHEFDPTGMGEIYQLLLGIVGERRAAGADGTLPFIDKAISGMFGGRPLTDAQIVNQLMSPLAGGVETVPKVAAHGLWELSKRPDQLAAVRADLAANAGRAFEEAARFCGPAQSFHRTVTERVEVLGETLEPGQRVAFVTASAARDPREFADPDEFRWDREITRTLAFGQGDHFCMGIHLARMEGRVLLQEFLAVVEEFEIDEANARRTASTFQQGWDHLPVVIRAYRDLGGRLVRPEPRG
ncbi:cytochrome P450 [Curtobacterium sp. VKM Ac-2887]|uniref:cytochrome P450 n=1 Tax=Curtobacterium sp. VKM Ac-2887 TaxID=2783819 RepID=UPI00188B2525|nr:cytochrome P450 [Curtobacterium sp. VKM Ac-2887]MBF4585685.1 cytochrome P450 [Curtobacterium sp. VKM Ac-2887]